MNDAVVEKKIKRNKYDTIFKEVERLITAKEILLLILSYFLSLSLSLSTWYLDNQRGIL